MKKQTYQKPAMLVVMLQQQQHLLAGSGYETIGTGENNRPAGARSISSGWDDEDE